MKDLSTRSSGAWRGLVSAVIGGTVLIGSGLVARADDVANNIDASVDSAAEAMNLTVGGPDGATQLRIIPTNEDPGKNGCNLTGQTKLTVAVNSSDTAVATVSPGTVTFDSCGAVRDLTVTPVGAGSATVSLAEVRNDTGGQFNLAPATFSVNVIAATPTDSTAPAITPAIAGTLGDNGWYTSDVTVTWTVVDDESPISSSSGCDPTSITTDTPATTLTCTATSAGGTSSQSVTIKRDATPPTVSGSRTPVANANGWNKSDVTVSFSCADDVSGIASCSPDAVLFEGADQSVTGTAVDNAGNSAENTISNINVDKTAPTVALVGGPADGGTYYFGFVPAAPTCSASDSLSGLDGDCAVGGYSTEIGQHTVTATTVDKAGNSSSSTASYTVEAWTLNGFYQPVDMNDVLNVVKGGSTVPMKFEVFAGSTELTDRSVVKSFTQNKIACNAFGVSIADPVEVTTTGGTSLRYDATGGQFVQNWKTPTVSGTCYKVTMTTQDGSSLDAFFKLK
jgi:hypothetical protein